MPSATALTAPAFAASQSFTHAAYFLERAALLITKGHPADCPEVAQNVDFARRKAWQGEQELTGEVFAFSYD